MMQAEKTTGRGKEKRGGPREGEKGAGEWKMGRRLGGGTAPTQQDQEREKMGREDGVVLWHQSEIPQSWRRPLCAARPPQCTGRGAPERLLQEAVPHYTREAGSLHGSGAPGP